MTLEVKGLNKYFGSHHAVQNLHLSVEDGKAVGLLGRNGAGKTTTIRMILGLLRQDSGSILWNGKPFSRDEVSFGYLPEERGLYPKMNVLDQLIYFGQLEGMQTSAARKEALKWVDILGIGDYIKKQTADLSKGNQQKVQLIAALMHDPDLVILDEPFSGLDPVNAEVLEKVIFSLIAENKTMIFSSHRMESVEKFCDDIYLMKHGKVVLSGSMFDIKNEYGFKCVKIESTEILDTILQNLHIPFSKVGREYRMEVKTLEEGLKLIDQVEKQAQIRNVSVEDPTLHQIFLEKVGDDHA